MGNEIYQSKDIPISEDGEVQLEGQSNLNKIRDALAQIHEALQEFQNESDKTQFRYVTRYLDILTDSLISEPKNNELIQILEGDPIIEYIEKRIECLELYKNLREASNKEIYDKCYSSIISLLVTNEKLFEIDQSIEIVNAIFSSQIEGDLIFSKLDLEFVNSPQINEILSENQFLKDKFINEVLNELQNSSTLTNETSLFNAVLFLKYISKVDSENEKIKEQIIGVGLQAIGNGDKSTLVACTKLLVNNCNKDRVNEDNVEDYFINNVIDIRNTLQENVWHGILLPKIISIGSQVIINNDKNATVICAKLLTQNRDEKFAINESNATEKFLFKVLNIEKPTRNLSHDEKIELAKHLDEIKDGQFTKLLKYGMECINIYFKLNRRDDLFNSDTRESAISRIKETIMDLNQGRIDLDNKLDEFDTTHLIAIMRVLKSGEEIPSADLENFVFSPTLSNAALEKFLLYDLGNLYLRLGDDSDISLVNVVRAVSRLSPNQYEYFKEMFYTPTLKEKFSKMSFFEQVYITEQIEDDKDFNFTKNLLLKLNEPCTSDIYGMTSELHRNNNFLNKYCALRNSGFTHKVARHLIWEHGERLFYIDSILERNIPYYAKMYNLDSDTVIKIADQNVVDWEKTKKKLEKLSPKNDLNSFIVNFSENVIDYLQDKLTKDIEFRDLLLQKKKEILTCLRGFPEELVKFYFDYKIYSYTSDPQIIKGIYVFLNDNCAELEKLLELADNGFRIDNLFKVYVYFNSKNSSNVLQDTLDYAERYSILLKHIQCTDIIESLEKLDNEKINKIKLFFDKYSYDGVLPTLHDAIVDNANIESTLKLLGIIYKHKGSDEDVQRTVFSQTFLLKCFTRYKSSPFVLNLLSQPFLRHLSKISPKSYKFYEELACTDLYLKDKKVLDDILSLIDETDERQRDSFSDEDLENLREIVRSYNKNYLSVENLRYFSFKNILRDELKVSTEDLIELNENYQAKRSVPGGLYFDKAGKLYINLSHDKSSFDLQELNIDVGTYQKLFPNRSLYRAIQGQIGNCYLIASIVALINSPRGKMIFLNSFHNDKDGLSIKIYDGPRVYFDINEFFANQNEKEYVIGSLGWRFFERYFSYYRLGTFKEDESLSSSDIERRIELQGKDHKRILSAGSAVFDAFMPLNNVRMQRVYYYNYESKKNASIYIGSRKDIDIISEGIIVPNHGYCVESIEKAKEGTFNVYLINPYDTAYKIKLKESDITNYFEYIFWVDFGDNGS